MTMDYESWAEWYDIFYSTADNADIEFYHGICNASGGPILEIGVGTGRVAIPLARQGMEVVGVDLNEPMLKIAQQNALTVAPLQGSLKLIQADMRNFDLQRRFPVVTLPARTLLLATSEEDQLHTLCCASKHLEQAGTMAFNVFFPDPQMLEDDPDEEFLFGVIDRPAGGRYVLTAKNHFDTVSQLNNGKQIVEEIDGTGEILRRLELDVNVRYLHPEQILEMCSQVGLEVVEFWGDFKGSEITDESDEIVVIARHAKNTFQVSMPTNL